MGCMGIDAAKRAAILHMIDEVVIGKFEQGYVHTPSGGTLFGMKSIYFDDYLPEVPPAQIAALSPQARALLKTPSAFFEHIGRMLEPMRGGDQPATGIPKQSRAYADHPGRHEGDIAAARAIVAGMLYREYVEKPGLANADPRILPQMMDLFIHVGEQRGWAVTVKTLAEADAITTGRYERYPAMTSAELSKDKNFAMAKHGGSYGTRALQRDIAADLEKLRPQDVDKFNFHMAKWRKLSRDCADDNAHTYCEGENIRADAFRPDKPVDTKHTEYRVARVQLAKPWGKAYEVAIETDQGLIRYQLKDDMTVHSSLQLPPGMVVGLGQGGAVPYREALTREHRLFANPYTDGTVLYAAVESQYMGTRGLPQIIYASPRFHEEAVKANRNTTMGVTNSAIVTDKTGRLDPNYSFELAYGGPGDFMYMAERMTPAQLSHFKNRSAAQAASGTIALPSTDPNAKPQPVQAGLFSFLTSWLSPEAAPATPKLTTGIHEITSSRAAPQR
jgi:hypothetical protein